MDKKEMKNLLFLDVEATGLTEEDRLVQVAYDFEAGIKINEIENVSLDDDYGIWTPEIMEYKKVPDVRGIIEYMLLITINLEKQNLEKYSISESIEGRTAIGNIDVIEIYEYV